MNDLMQWSKDEAKKIKPVSYFAGYITGGAFVLINGYVLGNPPSIFGFTGLTLGGGFIASKISNYITRKKNAAKIRNNPVTSAKLILSKHHQDFEAEFRISGVENTVSATGEIAIKKLKYAGISCADVKLLSSNSVDCERSGKITPEEYETYFDTFPEVFYERQGFNIMHAAQFTEKTRKQLIDHVDEDIKDMWRLAENDMHKLYSLLEEKTDFIKHTCSDDMLSVKFDDANVTWQFPGLKCVLSKEARQTLFKIGEKTVKISEITAEEYEKLTTPIVSENTPVNSFEL